MSGTRARDLSGSTAVLRLALRRIASIVIRRGLAVLRLLRLTIRSRSVVLRRRQHRALITIQVSNRCFRGQFIACTYGGIVVAATLRVELADARSITGCDDKRVIKGLAQVNGHETRLDLRN